MQSPGSEPYLTDMAWSTEATHAAAAAAVLVAS